MALNMFMFMFMALNMFMLAYKLHGLVSISGA